MATHDRSGAFGRPFSWAGYLLGFAMGGFFDGILLHQILQWHHLLSAMEGLAFRDLRVQVLADGLLSHWVLGIHRIRMDAGSPLLWDLVFFVPGVMLVVAGWLMRRRAGTGGSGGVRRRAAAPTLLAVGTLAAGWLAAQPASGSSAVTVVFGPGTRDADVFTAVASVDGRVVAGDTDSGLWIVDLPPASSPLRLYRHGALVVGGVVLPAGCFSPVALGRG